MLLSENLVSALDAWGERNISGIKVFCDEAVRESIAEFFINKFSENWEEAELKVEKEYGSCENVNLPAKIIHKDYGFLISLGPLEIRYLGGDRYDCQFYGYKALKKSLENMKKSYPQVEYEGYIGQLLSDSNGGEVWQEEISSITGKNVETYDFIGEVLNYVLENQICVPSYEPLSADDVKFAVTGKLDFFENREEITEYIEELGGNVVDGVSKNVNYLINNDVNSNSSKNKKAKELGIPIIGEKEFIGLFGDPEEFDIDTGSDFWASISEEMYDYDYDCADVVKSLYAYSKYIQKEYLDRAVRGLGICIDESIEEGNLEEDDKSKFLELVEELENN